MVHSSSHRTSSISADIRRLPAAMRPYRLDWPLANQLWERYRHHGDASAFEPFFISMLPFVTSEATRLKKRHKLFEHDAVDDLISDGTYALLLNVRRTRDHHLRAFCYQLKLSMRVQMRRGAWARHFGGEEAFRRDDVIRTQRAKLTQQLGREPNREELTESLRALLTNSQIQIGELPRRHSIDTNTDARDQAQAKPARGREPDQAVIDDEVVRVARESLDGLDRRIFDLVIKGYSSREIMLKLKLKLSGGRLCQRINGVLWLARSNHRIASYLDTEPDQLPAGPESQWPHLVSFDDLRRGGIRMAI